MGPTVRLVSASDEPAPFQDGDLVVCPDEPTRAVYASAGVRTVLLDRSIFDLSAAVPVRDWCLELGESWRLDAAGRDFTEWNGVSLGRALEGVAWSALFGPAYKFAHHLDALLERERPRAVCAERSLWRERGLVAEALCRRRGVPLEWTGAGAPAREPLLTDACTWSLTRHPGKKRLLNAATWLTRPRRGRRVLASYYFTLEGVLDELGADPDVEPAFFDWPSKRLFSMRTWPRWRFLADHDAADPLSAEDRTALSGIAARWETLAADPAYARRFEPAGLPVWEAARALLDDAVRRDFPRLASELLRLRRALDAWTPELVIVPYDGSPPERLLLFEARRRGIASAVVLHGIPAAGRHNRFMDTQADHVFIGGPAKIPIHRALGVPEERIHATGFPPLDRYASRRRKPRAGRPRVLVLSHYGAVEENVVPIVDVLRRFPDLRVVVKMHPGESVALYRKLFGSRLDTDCRLEDRWNLSELLTESDLVIGGPSTAVIEAMALGLPVALVNFQGIEATPPFDGNSGLECHRDPESLARALAAWLPDRLPERVDHTRCLDAYAGKPDGLCTRRTVDGLLALLPPR